MNGYLKRVIRLITGLFLFALGSYLTIQANLGLAPWEAFSMGGSYLTGLSYGDVVVATGLIIIGIDFLLREKIGFGTVLNAILIGKFVDLIQFSDIIPQMTNLPNGLVMMATGQVAICLGSFFYIGAALGCGPRDALMIALAKLLPQLPIGAIRGLLEGTVLIIGWALGAQVGLGTAIYVAGIGFVLQFTFKLLNFDVTSVAHESINETIKVTVAKT